jgi:hypothetical protein
MVHIRPAELTSSHIGLVVPTFQQRKLVGALSAEKMPTMVRVLCNQVLFPNVMREYEVC